MSNATPDFPSTDWAWQISNTVGETAKIIHPSGFVFMSPVVLNRFDRLEGHDSYLYKLTEKDSFLLSYTIDYFKTKSRIKGLSQYESMILAANIVCSYRFRSPLGADLFTDQLSSDDEWRKFGEHSVIVDSKEYEVFVIGHNKGTLVAVTMDEISSDIKKLELIEMPRHYFKRKF
ncbi:hypothetical protein A9Q84_01390 [Halobacteriovorax marinus]|uniref:Uncharacterized protein n=1 Tax=Halobacteriovorax marinus TaxID=97084 RepID=A0A1Y5FHM0_9BACT|nr:hypothetical protein A9Q84_01390 [Halobacteriovorax marinus]